jgi:hypothetical protein
MEQKDVTEPVGFYFPGAREWRKAPIGVNGPPRDYEAWEIEEFVDRWEMDEQ